MEFLAQVYYYTPMEPNLSDELLMQAIDRIYMEEPTYGSRRQVDELEKLGYEVGRDRVRRLMRIMDIAPIYPKPRLIPFEQLYWLNDAEYLRF